MEDRISELRQRLALADRGRRGRRRFGPDLRAQVLDLLEAWRAAGGRQNELARRLDISAQTLAGWCHARRRDGSAGPPSAIRAVRIVDDRAAESTTIAVTLPSGLRITGLDVASAVFIARELG